MDIEVNVGLVDDLSLGSVCFPKVLQLNLASALSGELATNLGTGIADGEVFFV